MGELGPWERDERCKAMAARTLTPDEKAAIRAEILDAVRDGCSLLDATASAFFRSVATAVNRLAGEPDVKRAREAIAGGAPVAETLLACRLSYDDHVAIASELSSAREKALKGRRLAGLVAKRADLDRQIAALVEELTA